MAYSDFQRPKAEQADPATRLTQHLQQQPQDLVDARRLMRHFRVSPEDFTHVLNQIEQARFSDD